MYVPQVRKIGSMRLEPTHGNSQYRVESSAQVKKVPLTHIRSFRAKWLAYLQQCRRPSGLSGLQGGYEERW